MAPAAKKPAAKKPAAKKPAAKPKPAADVVGNQAEVQARLETEGHRNVPPDVAAPASPPSTAPAHVAPEVDEELVAQIKGDAGESADAQERGFLGSPPEVEA